MAAQLGKLYKNEMGRRNGAPTLYHTWLLNVIASNHTERILPLVAPSLLGARALQFLRLAADVIYVDSSHELHETFNGAAPAAARTEVPRSPSVAFAWQSLFRTGRSFDPAGR